MKSIKRWRYYCDYCKKSGGSKYHMERHERSCTNNPNRVCRMCDFGGGSMLDLNGLISNVKNNIVLNITELETEYYLLADGVTAENILEKLRRQSECPTCILSALRQSGAPYLFDGVFDYKTEKKELWKEYNEDKVSQFGW